MERRSALSGILGLVLLIFALVDWAIAPGVRLFVLVNLVAGVFALILWATSSRGAVRSLIGHRAARYGANAAVYSLGFIGLLVAVNYLAALHHRRFDVTAERVFSLSGQSVDVVRSLKKPLKFYGFVAGGSNEQARNLYGSYAYQSPMVSFELVDPDRHPELVDRFKVSVMNTTHIQYGGDNGQGTNVTQLNEQALTNGILKVTRGGAKVGYLLDGHGEANPDDGKVPAGFGLFKTALEGENFQVKKLLLAAEPEVPKDASLLVIAGPVKPLLPHEIEQIDAYLKRGGRVLVMLRPPNPDDPGREAALVKFVADWGVKPNRDIVVDQVLRLFAGPALGLDPLVDKYGRSPITANFNHRTVFPMTRSLTTDSKAGLRVVALAKTSPTSWGETDLAGIFKKQEAKLDPADSKGPVVVAAAVDADLKALKLGDGAARLVVFGDTELASNRYLDDFFNRDFVMNSVDWLVGETNAISIRPRSLRASRINLTDQQFDAIFVLSVLLLPEALLILGIAVWWERRN